MCSLVAEPAAWKLLGVFTAVDLIALGLVVLSLALGYWSGFVWQIIRLASILVALWLAWYYHPVVAQQLADTLPASVRHMGSATIIFACTVLLLYLLFHLLREPVNSLRPDRPDRVLGAVLGLVKGALVVGLAALLILRYAEDNNRLRARVQSSWVATALSTCAEGLANLVSDGLPGEPREGEKPQP